MRSECRGRIVRYLGVLALLVHPAHAANIPKLADIPPLVAAADPGLVKLRQTLVHERGALRSRTAEHNARCSTVVEGSAAEAVCANELAALSADVQRHISASDQFNATLRSAEAACVQDAGYQLVFALRDCNSNQPSTFSYACLKGTGIGEKSLACLGSARSPTRALLSACGILATIPIDAAERCADVKDACIVQALENHKRQSGNCQR